MTPSAGTTVVARHARINGRVEVEGALVIEGRVEGTVRATSVTVAAGGVVLAEIQAQVAEIRGVVIGNVVAGERIEVVAGARVVGDLRAPDVALAAGAAIEGRVDRAAPAAPEPAHDERPTLRARAPIRRPARPGAAISPEERPAELPALVETPSAKGAPSTDMVHGGEAARSEGPPRIPRLPSRARVSTRRGSKGNP